MLSLRSTENERSASALVTGKMHHLVFRNTSLSCSVWKTVDEIVRKCDFSRCNRLRASSKDQEERCYRKNCPDFHKPHIVSRQCHWLKNISQRCYSLPAPKTQRSHSSVELLYGTLKQLLLDMAFRFLLPQLYDSLRVGYPSTSELSFGRDEEARPIENDSLSGCNASQLWHRY